MAHKTSKKKKKKNETSSDEQNPKSWPNLPEQLLTQLKVQPDLTRNITSFGCVIKSWRSTPFPTLIEIHGKHPDGRHVQRPHTIDIQFHEKYPYDYGRRSYNKCLERDYFKGTSHGQIVVLEDSMSCYLREIPRTCYRFLPKWDPRFVFKQAALTSWGDGFDIMVVTGDCSPAFAIYRWRRNFGQAWLVQNCDIKEPYAPNQNMRFCNVIGLGMKFYALSLQGSVVVIEEVGSHLEITRIGKNRAVPSKTSKQFREYLVESSGEIFVVLLISRKSIDVVVDVEVLRLDIEKLLWVKVEKIGDRALFIEDECCMWVEASEMGFKRNCVYFTHHRVNEWSVYDMEIGNILPAFGK